MAMHGRPVQQSRSSRLAPEEHAAHGSQAMASHHPFRAVCARPAGQAGHCPEPVPFCCATLYPLR